MNKRFLKWLGVAESSGKAKKSVTFFLFWGKDDDLIEEVAELMNTRKFSQVMRIALKVIPALMRGSLDELFEEFPWVKAEFLKYMQDVQPTQTPALPANIEKYLEEIIEKLDNQPSLPQKPVGLRKLAAPSLDDEELVVTVQKDTSQNSGANLINSLLALQRK
jgi:hypothetical protein